MLEAAQISRILDRARKHFAVSDAAEISLEANPDTVDGRNLREFRAAGINRISFGVQALQDRHLRTLGRIHTASAAQRSIHEAFDAGFRNVGADLMFGLQNQTLADWKESLERIVSLPLTHVSCYELAIEEGSSMAKSAGASVDADLAADMWETAMRRLPEAGFGHYEIANYARPGYACRHNLKYWDDTDFLGFGAGAWSCIHGARFANPRHIGKYISGRDTSFPSEETDRPASAVKKAETLMLNLRLRKGCREAEFLARYGESALAEFEDVIALHLAAGRLERSEGHLRLTRRGMMVANSVWADLLAKSEKSPPCGQPAPNARFFY